MSDEQSEREKFAPNSVHRDSSAHDTSSPPDALNSPLEPTNNEASDGAGRLSKPTHLGLSAGTETLDFNTLFAQDVTASGSYDLTGAIWATTFGKLLQALPIMAFLIDGSCRIVAANRACDKLGPEYQRTCGTAFSRLFPNETEAEHAERAVREVFRTRRQRTCQALMRMAKVKVWARLTFRSTRVGSERLVMVLVEDLTAETEKLLLQQNLNTALKREIRGRKRAEEDLAASERRYRQVVESANDIIYTTNMEGRFTYVNPVGLRKAGFSREEIVGRSFLSVIHPDHREEVKNWYLNQYAKRIPQTYYELPFVAKNGKTVWVGQNVQLLTEDEKVFGFQAIARDITDRKIAEEQLKTSLKEKEVLMREIHHRVKNNFQVISALLTLQADRAADKKSVMLLSDANARIRAMALVHEKLYQSNNLAQIRIDEYVGDLVHDLIGLNHETTRGIATKIEIEELYFVPDTAISIGIIITELLTNAMKHAFDQTGNGAVEVSLRQTDPGRYELLVSDNGIGIPADIRLEDTRSLGLALVTAFAKKLKGEIHLDRAGGTALSIRFGLT